jgi:hypothetical protein
LQGVGYSARRTAWKDHDTETALPQFIGTLRRCLATFDHVGQQRHALRELDHTGVAEIWVETPPDAPDWAGVRDRLQRAAA